jgi:pimeloyl-ACP methyl ester carboxylesterase
VSDEIELEYDTFGSPDHPAVLLVQGLGAQLILWDERFCQALADAGRYVIRFDNRDVGLSTKCDRVTVDPFAVLHARLTGGPMPPVPYTLSSMADDGFGLLDHLGVEQAHVIGASMGGMIVQTMAIEQPHRVLSLTSIMSTTGEPDFFESDPEALAALVAPAPREREAFIASAAQTWRIFCSPRYFDADVVRQRAAATYDRCFYPDGPVRQTAAIFASGDRAEALRSLDVPTLVIHGRADRLIKLSGGERTASLVRGATLLVLNDMGHDLPEPLWPMLVGAIATHTALPTTLASARQVA